jgi:hypothetical protein
VGRYSLHDISNENGELAANYAISIVMFLISTNFQHRKIHIGTWISPNPQTINQIDHVMVSKEKMRLINNVRLKIGYNCDSDHFLVQIKIKQKLITSKTRQVQKHKWDGQSLNQKEKISEYQEYLPLMLQEIKEETDINQDWQNIKQVILDAATEFQLARGVKKPNHWWDDECKKTIQERNEARRTYLIRKTRANLDNYRQKRTKANRTCRRKKKEWLERKIKEITNQIEKRIQGNFTKISETYLTHPSRRHWYVRIRMVKYYKMKDKYWRDGSNILKSY